jgi:gamma-glutamyl hydrolase
MTQPINETHNYIMAAYIKFIEQAGARVVPIHHTSSDEEILDLVTKINGVLFPGGSTDVDNEDGSLTEYSRKGKLIIDKAKEMNDNGIHFPIWGVCLGFQEITVIEAPFKNVLLHKVFDSYNVANNVTFVSNLEKSQMYRNMPQHLLNAMQKENITMNTHHDGVIPETFQKYDALKEYNVLAVSYDQKGVEYVATIEHKKYPIFAHQYHPEKNAYIWATGLVVPHSQNAIALTQYYSNFFVTEAKKNKNAFPSEEEAFKLLIENDKVLLTTGESQDIYLFDH